MQQVLFYIHSWLRWIILLAAAAALVRLVAGLAGRRAFNRLTGGLLSAYSGLMDLQALIGMAQLVIGWRGFAAASQAAGGPAFPLPQIEHLVTMVIAAAVAHLPARWKGQPDPVRHRNALLALVVSLALIVLGVSRLAGSRWVFRGL